MSRSFERAQYHEMHQLWNQADSKNTCAVDTYGAEHLARLLGMSDCVPNRQLQEKHIKLTSHNSLVSLPELIAQTNMDQQSVNRLREELTKFTSWFSRHAVRYFVSEYETPGAEYVAQARNV